MSVANQPSLLLSDEDNRKLFRLLGDRKKTIATSIVQLLLSPAEVRSNGLHRQSKCALCFVKDSVEKDYFFRVFSLETNAMLWEKRLGKNLRYSAAAPFLHVGEEDGEFFAFYFWSVEEAAVLKEVVMGKMAARQELTRKKGRAPIPQGKASQEQTPFGSPRSSVTSETLLSASSSQFSESSRTSPTENNPKPSLHLTNPDETVKLLLEQAGVTKDQLRDEETRQFISSFLQQHGGRTAIEKAVLEENEVQLRNQNACSNDRNTMPPPSRPPLPRSTSTPRRPSSESFNSLTSRRNSNQSIYSRDSFQSLPEAVALEKKKKIPSRKARPPPPPIQKREVVVESNENQRSATSEVQVPTIKSNDDDSQELLKSNEAKEAIRKSAAAKAYEDILETIESLRAEASLLTKELTKTETEHEEQANDPIREPPSLPVPAPRQFSDEDCASKLASQNELDSPKYETAEAITQTSFGEHQKVDVEVEMLPERSNLRSEPEGSCDDHMIIQEDTKENQQVETWNNVTSTDEQVGAENITRMVDKIFGEEFARQKTTKSPTSAQIVGEVVKENNTNPNSNQLAHHQVHHQYNGSSPTSVLSQADLHRQVTEELKQRTYAYEESISEQRQSTEKTITYDSFQDSLEHTKQGKIILRRQKEPQKSIYSSNSNHSEAEKIKPQPSLEEYEYTLRKRHSLEINDDRTNQNQAKNRPRSVHGSTVLNFTNFTADKRDTVTKAEPKTQASVMNFTNFTTVKNDPNIIKEPKKQPSVINLNNFTRDKSDPITKTEPKKQLFCGPTAPQILDMTPKSHTNDTSQNGVSNTAHSLTKSNCVNKDSSEQIEKATGSNKAVLNGSSGSSPSNVPQTNEETKTKEDRPKTKPPSKPIFSISAWKKDVDLYS